ncbi:MAG: pseudouridine synthase [Desulfobulbaceae bacterium]|nr:pseudouridine synthase [Desulfobulbaceae bacterium]
MEKRLQKILAGAGVASRRKCEDLIRQGRITVNGETVIGMGIKVNPETAVITFDGRRITVEKKVYILLYKPTGYVTTLSDPQGRPIVTDLLPDVSERIFPVGRLDLESEGALLLTNDGRLGNYVLHPRYEVNKTYQATVQDMPAPSKLRKLEQGIVIDGRKTWPAKIRLLTGSKKEPAIEIIIHEGKKRQVRKMFQAIGHPVRRLKRTAYGKLQLSTLKPGKYRYLTQKDLKNLFSGKIPFTIRNIPA